MTTATMPTKLDVFTGVKAFLTANNIERNEEIDLALLAMISGVDILLLGPPGVGKTHLIELLTEHCITDAKLYTHLLAKDQSADEILGPRDIMAMKNGQIARITAGMLPEANFAYLDEIFKGSAPTLNPLLDVVANRVLKVGGQVIDCSQLITIFASSNELPEREDLNAFRDRIGITKIVEPVRTPAGLLAVTDLQLDMQLSGVDTSALTPLSLDDIHAIRSEVKAVSVPQKIRQNMISAQESWTKMAVPPSQRRIGQIWKVVKAHAWAAGRDEVTGDDFAVAMHMAWSDPEDAALARSVVLEFMGAATRKAARFRDALAPIEVSANELKAKLDAATEDEREELTGAGFEVMKQLRRLKKQVTADMAASTDTEVQQVLGAVVTDIDALNHWAGTAIVGGD